jgi:3-oxoacyl-[acyl-carrier protein] reductase
MMSLMVAGHTVSGSRDSPVALVTGASRGIGAETARILGREGVHVVVNYREKQARAMGVADQISASGGAATALRADLTDEHQVDAMFRHIRGQFRALDILVLNASGGMERDAEPGYALRLNRDAQLSVLDQASHLMSDGGRVVFVTSHQAHFHGRTPTFAAYETVAASKRAGEDAIRARIPQLAKLGISVVVVSGDMIDGTITVTLLDRAEPGVVDARRKQAGALPTVADFAVEVARAATSPYVSGDTIYVGGKDYLDRADTL